MRIRGLTLWLVLLGIGLASCGSSTHGLTVSWTFAGGGSCAGTGIDQVRITIPGEALQRSIFDCASGQVQLDQFYPGTYDVTVDALDATVSSPPTPLWSGTQTISLRGDGRVNVVLQPVSQQNAVAYLSWSFEAATGQAPQCGSGQTLDSVAILVDGATTNFSYNCGDGLGTSQVITPYVTPGNHTVQLVAYNAAEGQTAYAQTDPLTIAFATGTASAQALTMHWQVGGLAMSWAAYPSIAAYQANQNQPTPCGSTGIATVVVFLATPSDPNSGTQFSGYTCASGALIDNAPPGTWLPFVAGYDASGQNLLYFQDDQNVPQTVTVVRGHFYSPQDLQTQVFVPLFP
jgi:hypothetical protein